MSKERIMLETFLPVYSQRDKCTCACSLLLAAWSFWSSMNASWTKLNFLMQSITKKHKCFLNSKLYTSKIISCQRYDWVWLCDCGYVESCGIVNLNGILWNSGAVQVQYAVVVSCGVMVLSVALSCCFQLRCINELNKLRSLRALVLLRNPLNTSTSAMSDDTLWFVIVAKIASLTHLNRSEVSGRSCTSIAPKSVVAHTFQSLRGQSSLTHLNCSEVSHRSRTSIAHMSVMSGTSTTEL